VTFSLIHTIGYFYRIVFSEVTLVFLKRKGRIRPFANKYNVEMGHRHYPTLLVLIFVTEVFFSEFLISQDRGCSQDIDQRFPNLNSGPSLPLTLTRAMHSEPVLILSDTSFCQC